MLSRRELLSILKAVLQESKDLSLSAAGCARNGSGGKIGYPGSGLDSPNALGRLWATPAAWWCSQGWLLSLFSPEGFLGVLGPDQQPCSERWSFRVVRSAAILVWVASIAAFLSAGQLWRGQIVSREVWLRGGVVDGRGTEIIQ